MKINKSEFNNLKFNLYRYIINKYSDYDIDDIQESLYQIIYYNEEAKQYIHNFLQNHKYKFVYNKIYNLEFLPVNCIEWLELEASIYYSFKIDNINVHIISEENIKETWFIHIKNIIKWIKDLSNKQFETLDIFLILSPYTKKINSKSDLLNFNKVNSGVTFPNENYIAIFRKEEVFKVLIHELIHYLDLDMKYSHKIKHLGDKIKTSSNHGCRQTLLNEAITEAMAIVLHTKYYSMISNTDYVDNLKKEIKYSKLMYYLILYHLNIKSISDLSNFCQKTNVLAYYIFKYHILHNSTFILNIFNKKNIENILDKTINSLEIFDVSDIFTEYFKHNPYSFSTKMSFLDLYTII